MLGKVLMVGGGMRWTWLGVDSLGGAFLASAC